MSSPSNLEEVLSLSKVSVIGLTEKRFRGLRDRFGTLLSHPELFGAHDFRKKEPKDLPIDLATHYRLETKQTRRYHHEHGNPGSVGLSSGIQELVQGFSESGSEPQDRMLVLEDDAVPSKDCLQKAKDLAKALESVPFDVLVLNPITIKAKLKGPSEAQGLFEVRGCFFDSSGWLVTRAGAKKIHELMARDGSHSVQWDSWLGMASRCRGLRVYAMDQPLLGHGISKAKALSTTQSNDLKAILWYEHGWLILAGSCFLAGFGAAVLFAYVGFRAKKCKNPA